MNLTEYFEQAKGIGVLATTDASGQVDQAVYAKPCFPDRDDADTCCFIMANRLSHDNILHNPSAAYLFIEAGDGYRGKRLSLTLMGEESDPAAIAAVRRHYAPPIRDEECKFLVQFHVEGVRPLIGNG